MARRQGLRTHRKAKAGPIKIASTFWNHTDETF